MPQLAASNSGHGGSGQNWMDASVTTSGSGGPGPTIPTLPLLKGEGRKIQEFTTEIKTNVRRTNRVLVSPICPSSPVSQDPVYIREVGLIKHDRPAHLVQL
jgi:hypothetical protein